MRRLKWLSVALGALSVLGAAVSTSASASVLPEVLPTSSTTRSWTGESKGESSLTVLGSTLTIKCKSGTAEGTEEAGKPLGTAHGTLKECGATILGIKVACTGLGDAAGVILTLGTWHLVYDTKSPTLGVAVLTLISPEIHFSCSTTLLTVKGNTLCLGIEPTKRAFTHEGVCKTNGTAGDPQETKYFNDAGTEVAITPLEVSENGGAFKGAAVEGSGTTTYKVEVFADI